MQKIDFSKSFVLDEGVNKISVVDNQIKTSYNDNSLELSVHLKVELIYEDKEDLKEFEVKLDPIPLKYKYFASLKHELNSCDCVLDNNNLNINGDILLSRHDEEEICDFNMPLKDKLYQSLLDFRNKQGKEVEIISTLDNDENLEDIIEDENVIFASEFDVNDQDKIDNEEETEDFDEKENEISSDNIIIEAPVYEEENKVNDIKDKPLLRENFVSSFFFYRINKNESIDDVIRKFKIDKNEFYKYNQKEDYKENDLIQIIKK